MRCFYACNYLKKLTDKLQNAPLASTKKLNKKRYKYNPKVLMKNKKLTLEKIDSYSITLMKEVLFKKDIIRELLSKFGPNTQFKVDSINLLFLMLIKARLFLNCIQIRKDNLIANSNSEVVVSKFISDNCNSIYSIGQPSKC